MPFKGLFKKIFKLGTKSKQFSLGNQSWQRPPIPEAESEAHLSKNLAKNRSCLETAFEAPENKDIVFRELQIANLERHALLIFIDGLSDRETQNLAVLQPLMLFSSVIKDNSDLVGLVSNKLLPGNQVVRTSKINDVINGILDGSSILIIDGVNEALVIETKGWEHRGVERPANEAVVIGPQEGFTESFRSNTASVRRYLKDPKLMTEIFRVGKRSNTVLGIMYIKDIANPKLLKELKYRINSIALTSDYIAETGALQELLEDHPRSFIPQILSTERPDRVAAFIREGCVGIIMANSPNSLVLPITFTVFLHTAEDYYLRWPFGNFLRIIRASSIFIALLLPALYIAMINYHQEMIPTDLLLAITAAREKVPFPALIELLFMEFAFELIREAGIRIPSVIGPTIGIVGALILGQAAVAASIVSPILIVIIAITALGAFVVPNYSASFTIRLLRFMFTFLAGLLGFFGIAFGVFLMSLHMASLTSFGVPFLTPISPYRPKNKDRVLRPRIYQQPYRPVYLRPLDWIRQAENPRRWDRPNPNGQTEEDEGE